MSINKKEIIFLNRAYNDLDIQLPLIQKFAEDKSFNVRVIGYPCDGDMGSPQSHEAAAYMHDMFGVSFETVLDKAPSPLHLRLMYKLERFLAVIRNKKITQHKVIGFPVKACHVGVLISMRYLLKGELKWLDKVTECWNPLFLSVDEALARGGRSYMLDKIVRNMAAKNVPVYGIMTGHNVYNDPMPNKSKNASTDFNYKKMPLRRYLVPSPLDKQINEVTFPDENPEIYGNLRMDRDWIRRLHEEILVPPYMDKQAYMNKLPKGDGPRVVFMLSKLGYGIKLDELKNSLKTVANMSGVSCAIKPHTRGMKFDFMSPSEIKGSAIVPDIPSTLLIEWADIILFTGSSIVFHAMMLDKRVGFLQNCQYIQTIFDDGTSCDIFDNIDELKQFLKEWRDNGEPCVDTKIYEQRKKWQTDNIHAGLTSGLTAQRYKDLYWKDIKEGIAE